MSNEKKPLVSPDIVDTEPCDASRNKSKESSVKSEVCDNISSQTASEAVSAVEQAYSPSDVQEILRVLSLSAPKYHEGVIQHEFLRPIGLLFKEDTLQSHEKIFGELKKRGLLSDELWPEVHNNIGHNFSNPENEKVNEFAKKALASVDLSKFSAILEIGSGLGNDAIYFLRNSQAKVGLLEPSKNATKVTMEKVGDEFKDRVSVLNYDLMSFAPVMPFNLTVDMVYSHSTLHYFPPRVLKEKIFPLIAKCLIGVISGFRRAGKLCMAMKTAASTSAKSPNQIRLLEHDPYNSSFDTRDWLVRIYPESMEDIISLLEPTFDIEHAEIAPVQDYDRTGETEIFCYIIAKPKQPTYSIREILQFDE